MLSDGKRGVESIVNVLLRKGISLFFVCLGLRVRVIVESL